MARFIQEDMYKKLLWPSHNFQLRAPIILGSINFSLLAKIMRLFTDNGKQAEEIYKVFSLRRNVLEKYESLELRRTDS